MLSRSFLTLALLLASATALTQDGTGIPTPKTRKTLGFGFDKPHARFITTSRPRVANQHTNQFFTIPNSRLSDDVDAAERLIQSLLPTEHKTGEYGYRIREDSYKDPNTGVTHVYAKQTFQGLDVDDGNVNVNVVDGVVISYGNQFYHPDHVEQYHPSKWDQHVEEHFNQASPEASSDFRSAFTHLCKGEYDTAAGFYKRALYLNNGEHLTHSPLSYMHVSRPPHSSLAEGEMSDPLDLIMDFMARAAPDVEFEDDLARNREAYMKKMQIHSLDHLTYSGEGYLAHITNVPGSTGDVKMKLVFAQTPRGLELAWKFEVPMEDNWYETTIATTQGSAGVVLSVVDWTSDSQIPLFIPPIDEEKPAPEDPTPEPEEPENPEDPEPEPEEPKPEGPIDPLYLIYPWGTNDPTEGNRTVTKLSKAADRLASPYGWHSMPVANVPSELEEYITSLSAPSALAPIPKPPSSRLANFSTTLGNNVYAQENFEGQNRFAHNYRPDAGKSMNFTYPYAPKDGEDREERLREAQKHINATVTQLFYTSNAFHDLIYRYGFDEQSGNFQAYNFGRGGRENDPVIANAQDGSGFNNANFMTPPDGTSGRMRMYLWDTASPYRDGDFEAGIVIHELAHGVSTRLTGGPSDSSCLGWGESGGMGEGWGDFLATTIRSTRNYTDFAMGAWASNREKGIRNYVYSLNKTVNPETYRSVDRYFGVHPIGEVWAEILWVVLQRLITKHGFIDSLHPPAPLEDGTIPEGDFYRPSIRAGGPMIPKHGNSLMVQLVVNGMKLQPCRPGFLEARDAIIQADELLTGGENVCELWKGFATRGLGVDAEVFGKTPWGGGRRTDGYGVPASCST